MADLPDRNVAQSDPQAKSATAWFARKTESKPCSRDFRRDDETNNSL
jgi:hypothetical protein